MKKLLSAFLACLMVLSVSVFAAPMAADTFETISESVVDASEVFEAEAMEETSNVTQAVTTDLVKEHHVIGYSFDKLSKGTFSTVKLGADTADVYNMPVYFPADNTLNLHCSVSDAMVVAKEEGSTDLFLDVTPPSSGSSYSRWYVLGNKELPNGTYRMTVDMKAASQKNFAFNIMQTTNDVIAGSSITLTTDFQTFEKTIKYEKGVTNTTAGKTTLFGFQAYQESDKIAWSADNINLYYTPVPCKVTFAGKGVLPASVNVGKNGYLVPSEFTAGASDSVETFLGWSLTEGGAVLTSPIQITADTTLYSVFEEKEYSVETTSQYGKLAYYVDFDVASGTAMKSGFGAGLDISNYTTLQVPAISGMPAVVEMETYGSNYLTDGDNLVVKGTNFPRFWLAAFEKDATTPASFPKGVYTVEWCGKSEYVAADANKVVVNGTDTSANMWNSGNLGEAANATFKKDYSVYTGSFTYDGTKVITAKGNTVSHGGSKATDMTGGLGRIGLYTPGNGYSATPRYYKWVKVWYTPLTVNVTFDVNGMDVQGLGTKEVTSNFNPSAYTLADCGTSRFAGWSFTPDGDLITETTVLAEDTTLYAVWDDYYYAPEDEDFNAGKLLAHIHFNNVTASANLNSQIVNYGIISNYCENYANTWIDPETGTEKNASGKKFPQVIISTEDNNANMNQYPANIWLNGRTTDKFLYNADNNGSLRQKHPDNEMIICAHKPTATKTFYPKLSIHNNGFGTFADGIYTFAAEVYVPEDSNISSVTYNAFATDSKSVESGTVKAKDLEVGKKVYIKYSILICDGVAYDYETMQPNGTNLTSNKVMAVGLNFQVNTHEAVNYSPVIHADNFRIYFKPYDASPKSYRENSIRVNSPAGIRFKSSVSNIERNNEKLTEYGFIVTLKDLLGTTDVNDFTHETEVVQVEGKNYDKANNIDKLFLQEQNHFFFTAVVFNIPADQYARDLVVRPYAVVDGEYVYGEAMINNIASVAEKIKASSEYENYKYVIDKILAGEEL